MAPRAHYCKQQLVVHHHRKAHVVFCRAWGIHVDICHRVRILAISPLSGTTPGVIAEPLHCRALTGSPDETLINTQGGGRRGWRGDVAGRGLLRRRDAYVLAQRRGAQHGRAATAAGPAAGAVGAAGGGTCEVRVRVRIRVRSKLARERAKPSRIGGGGLSRVRVRLIGFAWD